MAGTALQALCGHLSMLGLSFPFISIFIHFIYLLTLDYINLES